MHEPVIENLEDLLSGAKPSGVVAEHLRACSECSEELASMTQFHEMLDVLKPKAEVEPLGGFYARVMNRIETQVKPSIWSLFGESLFAKRVAYTSAAFVLLLGTYVISSERSAQTLVVNAPEAILADDAQYQTVSNNPDKDRQAVLVTLASYQE